ncbi:Rrf2 family transcriptional regulator [Paraburkholderia dinghuensis]|uniref:Rrf2 family transcriptional regulator n=1 Tax=Paraburkholderia dinghuensis TaxID=2305225 RepID=A0A3N6NTS5_9BURK|nr:Rrf2 family transcriptional regulator [Paraburkholderia dinghuensis]RQH03863.1 Rrf2 family transcriptional regulator [Paraburkholderia dinghuensis]
MRLTGFTRYGLLALVYTTAHADELITVEQISAAFGISRNYLTKVVHALGKAGYLSTARGRAGGLRLGRPAGCITVGEIVRVMERNLDVGERFDVNNDASAITASAELRCAFAAATRAYFDVLDRCTFADLASEQVELTRLLIGNLVSHPATQQSSP